MAWTVEFFNEQLREKLESLPTDIIASFLRISRMIEGHGLLGMREPYVKHLEGPLLGNENEGTKRHRASRVCYFEA